MAQARLHKPNLPQRQQGAFLVIALILLVVLSSLGVGIMGMASSSSRVGNNFSNYLASQVRSLSMAGYGLRIMETFQDARYYGPATCDSDATCNVINNSFPMNGRPLLPWAEGEITQPLTRSSETSAWWNTNSLEYEGDFQVGGNSDVIVTQIGAETEWPYLNTYRIVGYADATNGTAKTTTELFYSWKGYPPDPGGGTCATGCHYGQCCSSSNVCSSSQAACESGSAAYVPPGWTCSQYFVTGLGYAASTCNNFQARLRNPLLNLEALANRAVDYAKANGNFPSATQLGLPGASGANASPTANIDPNATTFIMFDFNSSYNGGTGSGCGRAGYMVYLLSPAAIGIPSTNLIQFECNLYHVSGEYKKDCGYIYGTNPNGANLTNLYIPGFINGNTNNTWNQANMPSQHSPYIPLSTCN